MTRPSRLQETRVPVAIAVSGFVVTSPETEREELRDLLRTAAAAIASDVGSALASIGTSSIQGDVFVSVDGVTGGTDSETSSS